MLFESFDVDFIELVDIRKDLRHLTGETIACRIVEFEMREIGNAARFRAIDFHRGAILQRRVSARRRGGERAR